MNVGRHKSVNARFNSIDGRVNSLKVKFDTLRAKIIGVHNRGIRIQAKLVIR